MKQSGTACHYTARNSLAAAEPETGGKSPSKTTPLNLHHTNMKFLVNCKEASVHITCHSNPPPLLYSNKASLQYKNFSDLVQFNPKQNEQIQVHFQL